MNDRRGPAVVRPAAHPLSTVDGLSALLVAYHVQTETEKGRPVANAAGLPDRYRAEAEDPDSAFADAVVLVAREDDGTAAGCVVVTAPVEGRVEINGCGRAPRSAVGASPPPCSTPPSRMPGGAGPTPCGCRCGSGARARSPSTNGSASPSPRRPGTNARVWSACSGS